MYKSGVIVKMCNPAHWYFDKNRFCYSDNIGDNEPLKELPTTLFVVIGHVVFNFSYEMVVYDVVNKSYKLFEFHIFSKEEDGIELISDNEIKAQLITARSLDSLMKENSYRFLMVENSEELIKRNRRKIDYKITESCYSVGDKVKVEYYDGVYEIIAVAAYDLKRYAMKFRNINPEKKEDIMQLVLPLEELTLVERAEELDKVNNTDVLRAVMLGTI